MWGKATRSMKGRLYPAIAIIAIAVLGLGSTWLLSRRNEALNPTTTLEPLSTPEPDVSKLPDTIPSVAPSATPSIASTTPLEKQPAIASTTASTDRQGVLRISNPTNYPVRVVLLFQKGKTSTAKEVTYDLPAHWDFAPQEGGEKGLLVSLPNRTIKVKPGDVLVAFAQDGSRRYWGPYVIGATAIPAWSARATEWALILPP